MRTGKDKGRDRGDGATRESLLRQIRAEYPGSDSGAQRARLLAAMQTLGSVTELRDHGAEIVTAWAIEPSEAGRDPHRQARYIVKPAVMTAGGAA